MNIFTIPPLRLMRRYAQHMRALRDDIRTERIMESLSADIRRDIGWPAVYHGRRGWRHHE